MSLTCKYLETPKELETFLSAEHKQSQDFYLTFNAALTKTSFGNAVASMELRGCVLSEEFTHCYAAASKRSKAVGNSFLERHGLGLRTRYLKDTDDGAGMLLLFVNTQRKTELYRRRAALPQNHKLLSAEERLRRTAMHFDTLSFEDFCDRLESAGDDFYLTSLGVTSVRDCQKGAVTSKVFDKQYSGDCFRECILAQCDDTKACAEHVVATYGLGMRERKVKASPSSGFVMAFLSPIAKAKTSARSESAALVPADQASKSTRFKQRMVPATIDLDTDPPCKAAVSQDGWTDSNDIRKRKRLEPSNMDALPSWEKVSRKLTKILPDMTLGSLSTTSIQTAVEQKMNLSLGCLKVHKKSIGKFWKDYVQSILADASGSSGVDIRKQKGTA